MATGRSFAEFVKNKCYNGLYQAAEDYVNSDWQSLNLYARHVHRIGEVEFIDADIKRVYVRDLPGMRVAFEVGLELEIEVKEGDYHYDNSDTCYPWVRVCCEGDLACGLDDWEIISIAPYNPKNAPLNSLSDALVPFVPFDRLEDEATAFLKEFYPEALKITSYGQKPVTVEPDVLAKRLGLNILMQRIREDGSVYGQLYFVDTDAEMYDAKAGTAVTQHIPGKTIVVDPYMFLLRTIGCANNTIIHECVHWVKHRKVFELEKLYNDSASCISCEVVGGAAAAVAKKATEIMERQANQLAPRIQMPAGPFRAKAKEYSSLSQYIRGVVPGTYTISVRAKKTSTMSGYFYVTYNGNKTKYLFNKSTAFDWTDYSVTLTDVTDPTLRIYCYCRDASIYLADIMISEGAIPRKWTPAPNKIYTQEVKIDKRGIEVSNSASSQRTVITNTEFAGYYNDEVIFTLNKDETQTKKTTVDGELTVGKTKFVPMPTASEGLNIVILD